jgi:hypothetical protein
VRRNPFRPNQRGYRGLTVQVVESAEARWFSRGRQLHFVRVDVQRWTDGDAAGIGETCEGVLPESIPRRDRTP